MSGYEVQGQGAGPISVLVQRGVPSRGAVTAGAPRDGKRLVRSVGGQTLEGDLAVGQRDGKGTHDLDSRGDQLGDRARAGIHAHLVPTVIERADAVVSLGAMTWPHLMVRSLLLEQLYRAQQILAGHPYHRD